jgi:hypothetical protein
MYGKLQIVNLELKRLAEDKGITPRVFWHYDDWGSAHLSECGVFYTKMPHPTDDLRLGICIHEIGHFYLGHMNPAFVENEKKVTSHERTITRQLEIETEACEWAVERMKFYGQNIQPLDDFQNDYLRKIRKDLGFVQEMNSIIGLLEELIPVGLKPV